MVDLSKVGYQTIHSGACEVLGDKDKTVWFPGLNKLSSIAEEASQG